MAGGSQIRCLDTIGEREIQGLSDVLIDCVEGGASVSFMLPMSRTKVEGYWREMSASVARGERVVLAAEDTAGKIVGTVQVIWAEAENQPHRGDVAKMLVLRRARRHGIGAALLAAAERTAFSAGKTLLGPGYGQRRRGALVCAARLGALWTNPRLRALARRDALRDHDLFQITA